MKQSHNLPYILVVALVAIVGIVILVMQSGVLPSAGEAVSSGRNYRSWMVLRDYTRGYGLANGFACSYDSECASKVCGPLGYSLEGLNYCLPIWCNNNIDCGFTLTSSAGTVKPALVCADGCTDLSHFSCITRDGISISRTSVGGTVGGYCIRTGSLAIGSICKDDDECISGRCIVGTTVSGTCG